MKIYSEVNNQYDFNFWSGAKDTIAELTDSEIRQIFNMLEDCYPEGMSDSGLNDFFWFERDTIAEWLGYEDFDQIMEVNKRCCDHDCPYCFEYDCPYCENEPENEDEDED